MTQNLPLSQRKFDYVFIVFFCLFALTSAISDIIPTVYGELHDKTGNYLVQINYNYAISCDPLYRLAPVWLRFVTGLSALVYGPFYLVLVVAIIKGWNRIQVPAIMYATAISVLTGVVVFGVEFFGEPQYRCSSPSTFLPYNLPYVIVPILLLIRMRKEMPFTRKF